MADAATPTLYRAITCNFCQRSEIAFAAKGVAIDVVDIDLVERPDWYWTKASGGSVPLLEWDDQSFHPSRVINEFIDERWPDPPLLPADPHQRAEARMWIDWWDQGPCPAYERRLMNVVADRADQLTDALLDQLADLDRRLGDRGYTSGYWHGERLGLVDATAAPMFVRFVGLRHFHDLDIPAELTRVRAWHDTLVADPHVVATTPPTAELLPIYEGYLDVLADAAAAGYDVPVATGG